MTDAVNFVEFVSSMVYINASGEMFLRQEALENLNTSVLHVVATAADSGEPPRQVIVMTRARDTHVMLITLATCLPNIYRYANEKMNYS